MRVGSIVYATDQGLGILAKSFYDAGVITNVCVIRHGRHTTHDDWYPGAPQISNLRDRIQQQYIKEFCLCVDVMFFFETPFDWTLIPWCREYGVKTVLMPMFECMPQNLPYQPDQIINPSLLDQQYYPEGVFIPVPVEYPWRQRTKAEVFVHNAGHGGLKGRNGTRELLQSMTHVKSPIRLIVRIQSDIMKRSDPLYTQSMLDNRIDWREGTIPYQMLWDEHDVLVFPEKFNGLSLPLQEARAAGMLVMCGNRFPMNTWLPTDPLIRVDGYVKNRIGPPYNEFDEAVYDPKKIASKIDEWFGVDITEYSETSRVWADRMSWSVLKPKYMELLERLVSR